MTESIISKVTYITDEPYVYGVIRELDIKAANINTLFRNGSIDEREYNYLQELPKKDREVYIGLKIQSNKSLYDAIQNGIVEAKCWLSEVNNLQEGEIVRVANDAVYVKRSSPLQFLKYDNIEFVEKSIYSSMLNLNGILLFFSYNSNGELNVDVKGINENELQYHNGYILSIIGQTIYLLQRSSSRDAMMFISDFYERYINRQLSVEMYRPFDKSSAYQIYGFICYDKPKQEAIKDLDIRYNLNILRILYGIVLEEYMKGR